MSSRRVRVYFVIQCFNTSDVILVRTLDTLSLVEPLEEGLPLLEQTVLSLSLSK
jgi:hypothetical protein